MISHNWFLDSKFPKNEQIPRSFTVTFKPLLVNSKPKIKVLIDGNQVGDIVDDNSRQNDFYRYHDVFHYTFAAILGWSPCARSMMKRKRKSVPEIDEMEDGARAAITEEAISLIIFDIAKRNNFFKDNQISPSLISQIKTLTSNFEVSVRSNKEWKKAILIGYTLFQELIMNNGGRIHFDMHKQTALYEK